jgi:hypothetical protein
MKHAGPQTLASLAPLLQRLRAMPALVERRPGVFYLGSRAYLHFHDDPAGIFADVKLDLVTFVRLRVSTAGERASFVARVVRSLRTRHEPQGGRQQPGHDTP